MNALTHTTHILVHGESNTIASVLHPGTMINNLFVLYITFLKNLNDLFNFVELMIIFSTHTQVLWFFSSFWHFNCWVVLLLLSLSHSSQYFTIYSSD